jgi:hypothetical protein
MDWSEKRAYVGSMDQLVRVTPYRMTDGRAAGVLAADVMNETGVRLTVVADRCMDIADLSYQGVNMGYRNRCGVVAPQYYEKDGSGWMRSFTAGFMTTCGLLNIGSQCEENGCAYGLHGRIGNTPARAFSARVKEENGIVSAVLSGEMNESVLFGENLTLSRTITLAGDQNVLTIADTVKNEGFVRREYMLLYHINAGYPFLSPACRLVLPKGRMTPRNEWAASRAAQAETIEPPALHPEMCYYYTLPETENKMRAGIFNEEKGIGFAVTFDTNPLKRFVEWKNLVKGCYVLGLEPATNFVDGRTCEKERDTLPALEPQAQERHEVKIEFFQSSGAFFRALGA